MRITQLMLLMLSVTCVHAQKVSYDGSLDSKKPGVADLAKNHGVVNIVRKEIPYSLITRVKDIYTRALGDNIPVTTFIRTNIQFNSKGLVDHWTYGFEEMGFLFNGSTAKPQLNRDSLSRILNERLPAEIEKLVSRRHMGKEGEQVLVTQIETTDPAEIARMDSLMGRAAKSGMREPDLKEKKRHVARGLAHAMQVQDTAAVTELYLEKEMLETIPTVIYRFPNLEILSLSNNDIEFAVIDFKRLPKLHHLKLSENMIGNKGLRLTKNNTLKLLNLQSNSISAIPSGARKCKKLEMLWLGRNTLTGLKSGHFKKLKQVKDINFYQAGISVLPKGIQKMKGLEVLDLYYNDLTILPKSIVKLSNLTHLAVAHNRLSALPEDIGKLDRIHTLFAHHNHLNKLPASIVNLKGLQIVDLGFNWFTEFPEVLTQFSNLDELDISANNFREFPKDVLALKKLNKLHLRGNPFLTEDREVKYQQQFGHLKARNIEVFY